MTLIELQQVLGDQINAVLDDEKQGETRCRILENAAKVSSLAKEMVRNADINLRIERARGKGQLASDSEVLKFVK